jgi:hypothetical protein
MSTLTTREADIFRCVADTVVAPEPARVDDTHAVAFFQNWLDRSPALNRLGLRALLYGLERAPLATGHVARLRRLPAPHRRAALARLRASPLAGALAAIEAVVQLAYYGDDAVMRSLGYDADALVARCADLRAKEARW